MSNEGANEPAEANAKWKTEFRQTKQITKRTLNLNKCVTTSRVLNYRIGDIAGDNYRYFLAKFGFLRETSSKTLNDNNDSGFF